MNILDLIIGAVLLYAIYNGWKQGLIIQLGSLAGIIVGLWIGSKFGDEVGAMLNFSAEYRTIGGFFIVALLVIILVAVLSRVARNIFKFVGFGLLDILMGVALSLCKFLLILSVMLSCVDYLNKENIIISSKTIAGSLLYRPIVNISKQALPIFEWAEDQYNSFSHGR